MYIFPQIKVDEKVPWEGLTVYFMQKVQANHNSKGL